MSTKKTIQLKTNDGYYFPLFNLKGLRSSITPYFGGDLKLDQHHYALEPTTEVDLYNNIFSRNVIFKVDREMYFLNGQTHLQQKDELIYEAELLYQKVTRTNPLIKIEVLSYIPLDVNLELHEVKITNQASRSFQLEVTTATPLYARSADNLRDHRQVTSLLNQIEVVDHGILVEPTLSFDERGHQKNDTVYSLFAKSESLTPRGYIPVLDDFIKGGSLHFPKGLSQLSPLGTKVNGYEAIGAVGFNEITLKPGETIIMYISIGIHQSRKQAILDANHYLNVTQFYDGLEKTVNFFKNYVSGLQFDIADSETSDQ
ncbi:MAG: hypothetical protein KKH92_05900, partial [Firmicutes bacterium]|nr:hypothetical protein [Bacillota bacterium]